ncbi:MAG: hypothetical protein JF603_00415 [Acidobacteria bacterium]|nr:hypothetical protein [Acidobacteriota bacterium]
MTGGDIDFEAVLRDIDEEVRARRASGDFPAEMERELDRLFAQYVPVATSADDLGGLIAAAQRASFIDPEPPTTASRIPGVAVLKTAEQKLLGWYFRFLAQQVTAFAHVSSQALETLAKRVDALAASTQGAQVALEREVRRLDALPPADLGDAVEIAATHLTGATGRVLVVEAGDGALVRSLAGIDVDVYGIEPSVERATALAADGLDVRDDAALLHLHSVAPGSLGGLALCGCIDRLPLDGQLELADLAAEVVAPGAPVVVLGRSPDAWGRLNPVEADLAPGRPLRAATWAHLLTHRGFTDVLIDDGDESYAVRARRPG